MAMNKRGIFFTMISVLIVAILVLLVTPQASFTSKDKIPSVESRVRLANAHLQSLESSSLSRTLFSSSHHALYALTMYMNWTLNDFVADEATTRAILHELVINGTIGQSTVPVTLQGTYLMQDNNFTYRLRQLENLTFQTTNLNVTFNKSWSALDEALSFYQSNSTGPWRVGVNLTLNYTLDAGIARWNRTATIVVHIPITALDDPLYFAHARRDGDDYTNKIVQTNITAWNVTKLWRFVNESSYRSSPLAPSFFMRLYNDDDNSSCCGIESTISAVRLGIDTLDRNDPALQKSFIDWCFYGIRCPPDPELEDSLGGDFWNVTGATNYTAGGYNYAFKIDTINGVRYNVTTWLNHTYCDNIITPCTD